MRFVGFPAQRLFLRTKPSANTKQPSRDETQPINNALL
jgi:hypothetical protein